ncbi:MAG: hypothetical protein ABF330_09775, partial [Lentimonas sp.]
MVTTATARGWKHPFDNYRRERRWTSICALLVAFILHLGIVLVLPEELLPVLPSGHGDDEATLEVTLLEPEALTPDQLKFVEVNPEAPENKPDREDQYSFRNQQAASENVSESLLEAPEV